MSPGGHRTGEVLLERHKTKTQVDAGWSREWLDHRDGNPRPSDGHLGGHWRLSGERS